jgi:hypothetical protein
VPNRRHDGLTQIPRGFGFGLSQFVKRAIEPRIIL